VFVMEAYPDSKALCNTLGEVVFVPVFA